MKSYLIDTTATLSESLRRLNQLGKPAILIVVDTECKLVGALTDGDIRRALIKGKTLETAVKEVVQTDPVFIRESSPDAKEIRRLRRKNYTIIPVLDDRNRVIDILDLTRFRTRLPISSVIMAGGKGKRLMPLTKKTPKALLPLGEKPILEHIIDYHATFGITDFHLSVNHLKEMIQEHFGNGAQKGIHIDYVQEKKPLGTIGGLSGLSNAKHPTLLLSNCDVLSNFDLENMYIQHLSSQADLTIATIPYTVQVPYGVIESQENGLKKITEKPTYTYAGNAGIYLFQRSLLEFIPKNTHFDAPDFIHKIQKNNKRVERYEIKKYWLDIGNKEDLEKAKSDLNTFTP